MSLSQMDLLTHPRELWALLRFLLDPPKSSNKALKQLKDFDKDDSLGKCYYFLNQTSRSFAAVVASLDPELRDPICIFYLVLRGLDTVEDDMTIPLDSKVPLLRTFHEKLQEKGWQFHENGEQEKDRMLLQCFDVVIQEFQALKPEYQTVIADICDKMGNGMADFASVRKVGSKEDWDLYCHYVAGLVGIGLCRMFGCSGLEDPKIAEEEKLANSMGLFLQKVNIIRDYLEDYIDGRIFWPSEIWSQYAGDLGDFRSPENKSQALACLNHLICNALALIPDCLQFMSMIKNKSVFRFCAIPQVMAIATLALCFDNIQVFQRNVKIRKSLALVMINDSDNFDAVVKMFKRNCRAIATKVRGDDPNALKISSVLGQIDSWMETHGM